jgi:hypothetical protein
MCGLSYAAHLNLPDSNRLSPMNRTLATLALIGCALLGNACALLQPAEPAGGPNSGPNPARTTAAPAAPVGGMCVREGGSCTAKGATCCASLLCVGIRDSICLQGY